MGCFLDNFGAKWGENIIIENMQVGMYVSENAKSLGAYLS